MSLLRSPISVVAPFRIVIVENPLAKRRQATLRPKVGKTKQISLMLCADDRSYYRKTVTNGKSDKFCIVDVDKIAQALANRVRYVAFVALEDSRHGDLREAALDAAILADQQPVLDLG